MERVVSLEKAFVAYKRQAALARRIGVCKQTVHGWRHAKKGLPPLAQILINKAGIEDQLDVWADKPTRSAHRKKKKKATH